MKRCPQCGREYDNTMSFCLDDGSELLYSPASMDEPATVILSVPPAVAGGLTQPTDETEPKTAILQSGAEAGPCGGSGEVSFSAATIKRRFSINGAAKPLVALVAAVMVLAGGFFGYRYFSASSSKQIESIAVMPFVNERDDLRDDPRFAELVRKVEQSKLD